MRQEQPELWGYLRHAEQRARIKVNNPLTFGYAAALTYDMIPQHLRREPITTEQLDAMHRSMAESAVVEDRNGTKATALKLEWCVKKLRQDSPAFMGWLGKAVSDLEDQQDKSDFIFGSLLVAMTFYSREDSRILAASLLGESD